jgi:NADH dehydrogenase FAD-containing subunit
LKPSVVFVVSVGFGSLNPVKTLNNAPVKVVLVDKNNYHLF